MNSRLNAIFYAALTASFIIFLLPPDYTMAVYTPNILGYFWLLVCLPVTLLSFVWLAILDLRNGNSRKLTIRTIAFASIVLISVGYWFYRAQA